MIKEALSSGLFLQYGGYYGFFGDFFMQLEMNGFFDILLPMLLVFALVFGILTKTNLFKENKAVNGIIALAVSFIVMRTPMVSDFFSVIFPQAAVALTVILVIVILIGIFIPNSKTFNWIFFGIGAVILVVVLVNTADDFGFGGNNWSNYWPLIAGAVFILALVGIIVGGSSSGSSRTATITGNSILLRDLFSGS